MANLAPKGRDVGYHPEKKSPKFSKDDLAFFKAVDNVSKTRYKIAIHHQDGVRKIKALRRDTLNKAKKGQ